MRNEITPMVKIEDKLMLVRDQYVLLDRDVAALYGVETRAVNQAVRRNAERFFDGYIFELTQEECSRSQIVTLNGKRGSNLNMLATILKGEVATKATLTIVETFAQVRQGRLDENPYSAALRKLGFKVLNIGK